MEYRSGDIQEFVDTVTEAVNFREVANRNLEETLDSLQDYMKFVDTVLDRNIIRSILVELYSVNYVSHLEGAKSKQTLRRARDEIPRKMKTFKDLKTNLMTVRNDMNNNQQQNLHKRLVSKMKAKKFKSRAKGAGRQKVADKFPQLAEVLELAFGEGSKIHPRLTSETRYKNPDLALTMAEARKILLTAASDKIPNIALSTCYTYTENYRKNSRQALRHHIDQDVNAKISLRKLPRVGMMEERVNAHYCRANVNFHLDMAANDKDDCLVDAKDAKGVICADIDPVQNIGKSWKKDNRLDHQFDQSRTNACTPMTHLFLQSITSDAIINSDNLTLMNVVRTGQPVTLVNISFFEPETIFRCFNELFLLLSIPALDMFFRNPSTHTLKKKWIFVVDNGPSEAPASTLVRMLLVRLVNFMNLEKATQISFEKLNSKDNPAERPHAAENLVLSRHGPFKSKELFIHKNSKPGSSDHLENMEAMAKDVIGCLRSAKFGSNQFFCFRGIQDQYIFYDETSLRNFFKLSEQGKDNCHTEYTTTDCPLLTDICHAWELQREFNGNYLDDYNHLSNSIDDDIRTAWLTEYSATIFSRNNNLEYRYVKEPLPDYIRWLSSNGELHYMCYEARQAVPFGEWDSEEQFLPTRILNLIGELFVDIPESVLDSVSLLTWLTPDQVQKELEKMTEKMSSQLKNEEIKERWKTHDLFKKTVAELQNEAKQLNIPNAMKSSKTELVKNIAQSKALTVPPDVDTYDASLSDISMDLNSLTNLSIFQLKSILKYHNLNYRGTKDELVMKVFLLRHKRSYMIIESVVSKITKLGEIAVSLIIWQRRHYNELKHVHRQRQYSVFKSSKTKSIIAVPEHITEENLHEAFDPFFDWLDNVLKSKLEIDQE
ncbi:Hypothetical predicted protein [Mytilus galloprovincialis]|uniref:SAP domain-containing protein n=1 Tax=Mytilus galloprovincialis TaxID=29158 RepID=A0A8B6ECS7_MYTGA|nr:Hypothetical predicted protein [Mytilus galloprovincialis]